MKLAELLSDMIANGASLEQISAVVSSSQRQESARDQKRREDAAERQRQFKARKKAFGNAGNGSNAGNALSELPKDAPVHEGVRAEPEPNKSTTKITSSLRSDGKTTGASRREKIAADAQPDEVERQAATDAGLTPAEFRAEWIAFRDHHRGKGTLIADRPATWRTWLRSPYRKPLNGKHARAGPAAQPAHRNGYYAVLASRRRSHDEPSDPFPAEPHPDVDAAEHGGPHDWLAPAAQ